MSADTNTPETAPKSPLLNYIFQEPRHGQYALDMTVWDIVKKYDRERSSLGPIPSGMQFFAKMCTAPVRDYFRGMPRVRQLIEADDNIFFDFGIDPFVLADFRNEYGYTCSA